MANRANKSGRHIIQHFFQYLQIKLSFWIRTTLYYLNIPVFLYFLGFKDKGKHGQKKSPLSAKVSFFMLTLDVAHLCINALH